jgi:hypothetical protein
MFKTFFWLLFLVITFATGYYFGERHSFVLPGQFSEIPSELSSRASNLEHTLKGIRLWMALNDSKDHLGLASSALEEKNFGSAVNEVREAKVKLKKAESLSQGELKKELKPLNQLILETEADLAKMDPKAKYQVDSAKNRIEKIISK